MPSKSGWPVYMLAAPVGAAVFAGTVFYSLGTDPVQAKMEAAALAKAKARQAEVADLNKSVQAEAAHVAELRKTLATLQAQVAKVSAGGTVSGSGNASGSGSSRGTTYRAPAPRPKRQAPAPQAATGGS